MVQLNDLTFVFWSLKSLESRDVAIIGATLYATVVTFHHDF